MVTHGNLLHNLQQTHIDAAYDRSSISVSWLPVNHDMGLINGVLQPAFSGCPAYLMSPAAFLQRPARWLQAISRLGATHSGAPNFAYDLCTRRVSEGEAGNLDLSSWRVAYNGSEPIRRCTLESFQRSFGIRGFRWEAFSPAYGLAESTLLVASIPAGIPPTFVGNAVASGIDPDGRGVMIVDPATGARSSDGAAGEIWVRGGSVAAGYWRREEETRATFQAFTSDTHDGPFLRTGDIGFIHQDRLFVSGRIKDLVIVRGLKHYPQDVELTTERAHPALRAGCCAAFSLEQDGEELLAIVAELDTRRQADIGETVLSQILAAVRVAVTATHHVAPARVTLVAPGEVPKTTSGKLQRFLCREALLKDGLDVIASWNESDAPCERAAS
jgi:acyl-CoA synthetase (AMP-forming)/AMP-acid ligase II